MEALHSFDYKFGQCRRRFSISKVPKLGQILGDFDDLRRGSVIHVRHPKGQYVATFVFPPFEAISTSSVGHLVKKWIGVAQRPDTVSLLPRVEIFKTDEVDVFLGWSLVVDRDSMNIVYPPCESNVPLPVVVTEIAPHSVKATSKIH